MSERPFPNRAVTHDRRTVTLTYDGPTPPQLATPAGRRPLPVRRVELVYRFTDCTLRQATAWCDPQNGDTYITRRLDPTNLPDWLTAVVDMYRPAAPVSDLLSARIAAAVDWPGAWAELTGYVRTAVDDGLGDPDPVDTAALDAYLTELHRRFVGDPTREAIRVITGGTG